MSLWLDYFVVGSRLVIRSPARTPIPGPEPRAWRPFVLEVVHDDHGPVGSVRVECGDEPSYDLAWHAGVADRLEGRERAEAHRLLEQVTLRLAGEKGRARMRWDRVVDTIDEVYADPLLVPWNSEPRQWDMLERLLEITDGGARVLDLGCGYGKSATALEPRGLEVHGIDVSATAIDRCRRLVRHPDRFHAASAERMPFDDGFFDAALDIGCLHSVPDDVREPAVAELARVLRPGGVLMARLFKPRDAAWLSRLPFAADRFGLETDAVRALLEPHFDLDRFREIEDLATYVEGARLRAAP